MAGDKDDRGGKGQGSSWGPYHDATNKQFPDTPFGADSPDARGGKYNSMRSGGSYDGPDVGSAKGNSGRAYTGRGVSMKGGYSGSRGGTPGGFSGKTGHPHLDGRKGG